MALSLKAGPRENMKMDLVSSVRNVRMSRFAGSADAPMSIPAMAAAIGSKRICVQPVKVRANSSLILSK